MLKKVFLAASLSLVLAGATMTVAPTEVLAGKTGCFKKVILPENVRDESFNMAGQFPYETKTSLQRDVESKGALNEGDLFGGTLIRFGEELNMEIPETEKTYKKLLRRQSTR